MKCAAKEAWLCVLSPQLIPSFQKKPLDPSGASPAQWLGKEKFKESPLPCLNPIAGSIGFTQIDPKSLLTTNGILTTNSIQSIARERLGGVFGGRKEDMGGEHLAQTSLNTSTKVLFLLKQHSKKLKRLRLD